METKIIYNEDGTVNVEATIQGIKDEVAEIYERCEKEQKEIDALREVEKDVEGMDFPEITDAARSLLTALKEEKTVATLKPYNAEEDKEKSKDLFYWLKDTYRDDEQLIEDIFHEDLFHYSDYSDYSKYFVSEIKTVSGKVIYTNNMPSNESCEKVCKDIAKQYGKVAGLAYLHKRIKNLDYHRIFWRCYAADKNHLTENVQEWFDEASKCVYPQRVQQLAKHLLICATEPDESEDEFSVYGCYKTGVEALKMLNEGKTVDETIAFLDETSKEGLGINMLSVYYFLLKYGKEDGVRIFEEKVMKPASERGEDEISYSDYHGTPAGEVQKMVNGIREENAKFEAQLKELNKGTGKQ